MFYPALLFPAMLAQQFDAVLAGLLKNTVQKCVVSHSLVEGCKQRVK